MSRLKELRKYVDARLNAMEDADKRISAVSHLYGVSLAASMIAKKRGLDPELASMAAMLHDLYAYESGSYDDHAHRGADLAGKVLGELGLTDDRETELICSAIYHHDDKLTTDSPMDEALKDADVIHHCMNDLSKAVKDKEKARFESLCREFGMGNDGGDAFRSMRRFKQQISREECMRVLKEQPRGVLSMIGDGGYPYGIPLSHWFCEEDGRIYFHGAKTGHKLDAIAKCDKVSFCVYDQGFRRDGEWALNINSVVVFGRIRLVEDEEKARRICTNLCRKFTDDEEFLRRELAGALSRVQCLELVIEHMTGKLVNES